MRDRPLAWAIAAVALLAAVVVAGAGALSSTSAAEPIIGRWALAGGVIDFVPQGGRFVSRVIRQRPGVVCPAVNDRSSQIVLGKRAARVYSGTWVWFDAATCRPAGKGATTITVAADGKTATMVADPPAGLEGQRITFRLTRAGKAAGATLSGSVGPGFTIALTRPRTVGTRRYTIAVDDRSPAHNFHIRGPGVDRTITSVPFVGRKTVTVVVTKGRYTFFCDPHAPSLRGSFTVG